jgi:predicted TIM-barrel fold metal-dependent hydrolase
MIARFVDAHIHLWDLNRLRYPWLTPPFSDDGPNGSVEPIAKTYQLADYFADAKGYNVTKVVHIDAGANPDDALNETRWLQSLADEGSHPNAIVGFAPLNDPKVEALLAEHCQSPNMRGIRHIINWHPDPRLTYTPKNLLEDEAFAKGYALLGKYDLSFDLQIYPNQMVQAFHLAKAHPDIPVIINHLGMPVDRDAAGIARWKIGMELLAGLPHVFVKISGLGFVDRHWTPALARTLILETIDYFGTHRCAFASDFPTDKLFNSYGAGLEAYIEATKDFSATERDDLFAGNAERIYRI